MNPYIVLAAVLALVGSYIAGRQDGKQIAEAKQQKAEQLVEAARDAMRLAAAEAISSIEIKHKTIRAEVQREIVEKPVYRDCRASDDVLRSINAAKTGAESVGDSELPGTAPVE